MRELFEAGGDRHVDPSLVQQHAERGEREHWEALQKTGFFGSAGAGSVFLAQDTGRLLLAHRSAVVEQPHTWGNWGGAVDRGLTPEQSARKEIGEECGYAGPYDLIPLYVFKKGSFQYFNYLAVVPEEFTPHLGWESQGFRWCEFGDWPSPLHFGLVSLFNDPASVRAIHDQITKAQGG